MIRLPARGNEQASGEETSFQYDCIEKSVRSVKTILVTEIVSKHLAGCSLSFRSTLRYTNALQCKRILHVLV